MIDAPRIPPLVRHTLSISDIDLVSEALRLAAECLRGFTNQPRASDGQLLTPGGDVLDDIREWLEVHADLVSGAAVTLIPANAREAELRGWVLLRRAAHNRDSLANAAALAAKVAADEREAECADRRERRLAA